jgi:hypothetical protein
VRPNCIQSLSRSVKAADCVLASGTTARADAPGEPHQSEMGRVQQDREATPQSASPVLAGDAAAKPKQRWHWERTALPA